MKRHPPELSAMHRGYIGGKPTAQPERKPIKPKTCSKSKGGCGETFQPSRPMQKACGRICAVSMMELAKSRKAAKEEAADKRMTRSKLEGMKTIPQLKKEAQKEFNAWVRCRDRAAGYACICCGRPLEWDVRGGAVDAGHYRSTGSADHLRFDELNVNAQRSDCNRFGAGRAVDYRIGLIARYGLARVEALESNNETAKWTREGLRAIRDKYRSARREMERVFRYASDLEWAEQTRQQLDAA
jgi:hypothetical protein